MRSVAWFLGAATGLIVANLYYCQPLLVLIAHNLGVPVAAVTWLPPATQLGYASGLLLLVPLGDRMERRGLMVMLTGLLTVCLGLVAASTSLPMLIAASYAVGVGCVSIQVAVPYAASLASSHQERGEMVGIVMSALLVGLLLSRTASGVMAAHWGWRSIYVVSAGLMLLLAISLRFVLKAQHPPGAPPYGELLRSMWHLLCTERVLQRHALVGAAGFAAFSTFWSTLDLYMEGPVFHGTSETVGVMGLFGAAGALAAPLLGKLAGRLSARAVNGTAMAVVVLSFIGFAVFGRSMVGLAIWIMLMDLGVQGSHISNQTRIFSLHEALRNRLNAVYMVSYFLGGAFGSMAGAAAWHAYTWPGVCAVGAICGLLGVAALFLL